jgi:hypothetical protein
MAGNRSSDKAGFQQIMAPISNRICFLDVNCSVDDWIKNYALKNNVRTDIITFLQSNPTYFQSTPLESAAWASPRSWTYASNMLDSWEDQGSILNVTKLTTIVAGHVGFEYAAEFVKYKELMMKWNAYALLNGGGELPDIGKLTKIDHYTLMASCIGELLKAFRLDKYDITPSLENNIDIFKTILEEIMKRSKEVIPLGLKILSMGGGDKDMKNNQTLIIKRLLDNKDLLDMLTTIIN